MRSGNNSAIWASSSSRAKPFSIFSIVFTSFQNGEPLRFTQRVARGEGRHIPQMSDL
jgi:hypothetical protein